MEKSFEKINTRLQGAILSEDGLYRYFLWRTLVPEGQQRLFESKNENQVGPFLYWPLSQKTFRRFRQTSHLQINRLNNHYRCNCIHIWGTDILALWNPRDRFVTKGIDQ